MPQCIVPSIHGSVAMRMIDGSCLIAHLMSVRVQIVKISLLGMGRKRGPQTNNFLLNNCRLECVESQ